VLDHPDGAGPFTELDAAGNAFEWVADWYGADYYRQSPLKDPPGPDTGTERVLRGGSYDSTGDEVTSARRFHDLPTALRADLGFRCVVIDAQCYAPECEVPSLVGRPWSPGHPPGGETDCLPNPPQIVEFPWCNKKMPWVNISGFSDAEVTWPPESACHFEGGVLACTGSNGESVEVKICETCTPVTSEAPVGPPECPPGYTLDESACRCKFTGTSAGNLCPMTPILTLLVNLPAQECCAAQMVTRPGPVCGPGYYPDEGCSCVGKPPEDTEPAASCTIHTFWLPTCGQNQDDGDGDGDECVDPGCQNSTWDPVNCCCSLRGKCL
jgi:hypothetical protein